VDRGVEDLVFRDGACDVAADEDLSFAVAAGDAEVGFAGFAGAFDHATHHRHPQGMGKAGKGGLDRGGEFVDVGLEAAAAGTGDDLQLPRPQAERLQDVVPAVTCSTGGAERETRMVSPMPSARRTPKATADLMAPWKAGPASVTPRWRG